MSALISNGYKYNTTADGIQDPFAYWRDVICEEYVQLDCKRVRRSEVFQAELRGGIGLANIQFSEVEACPQTVVRSSRQIKKSTEADFLISFQLKDRGLIRQNGREALLEPGSFAMYDSSEPYTLQFRQHFHQFIVQMPKHVMSQHLLHPEQYTAVKISAKSGLGAVVSNFIFSLARELDVLHDASDGLADNLVNLIAMAFSSTVMLEQLANQDIVKVSLKRRIVQYIDGNLHDPDLSNIRIAEAQGISVRYLHKLFESEACTLHHLIMQKRLQSSRNLLEDPAYLGRSIETIAYTMGFSSAGHFSRCFKKYYGYNPSELR